MKGILELLHSLADAIENGDLWGHLVAWFETAIGAVTDDDRLYVAAATGGHDGE